ncbi:MAG: acetolactate synthase large subunit [Epsilonproteobacteria bacterium]|nr:acetolactate synthase large subunit [Campylobacterota bacterium]
MDLNGSQMVIEALRRENVSVVFGYPGGAIMNVYDEIYKQNYFEHILTRHEQAAIHAADGYARASGKVGVAFVTSGPGFTNAVTGLATAYIDSVPMVVISGQVPISMIGTDAFQEIDAVGISRPCVKHNYLVKDAKDLPRVLKEAFYIASSGRPGPVHIDIPKDVTAQIAKFDYPQKITMQTYKPTYKGNSRQIKKVVDAIANSSRPILYIGGGAVNSGASELVREFAKFTGIPAVETLMARGVMGDSNPLLMGMVGMHGCYSANMAMSEADLMIALGSRFDDRVTGKLSEFAKHAKVVHVDIDPSSIGKIVDIDYPIVGDLKNVLSDMMPIAREKVKRAKYQSWRDLLKRYDEIHPLGYSDNKNNIKPQWVIQRVGETLGDKAIISTDVGQHQMWTAQFYPFSRPRQFITSGGLGTMGFGFPAAMGVKKAIPEKISINISGDGSILMNIQELMTAYESNIPVINIILNNGFLGMVRQWQTFFYDKRYASTDLSRAQPDFVKLAESFGGRGFRVETKKEFDEALKEAIKSNVVCMIDVNVDRLENVLPMVPAGGTLYNMMLEYKE